MMIIYIIITTPSFFWFTFSFVGHQSDDMVYDTNIYKTTNINTKRSDKVKNRNRRTKLAAAASQIR